MRVRVSLNKGWVSSKLRLESVTKIKVWQNSCARIYIFKTLQILNSMIQSYVQTANA